MSERERSPPPDAIAVIGIGVRLPGNVSDAASFWRFVSRGGDAIGPIPPDRFDAAALADELPCALGGFLDGVYGFDAEFFGLSTREAASMDPQQRLLLEVAWQALEDARLLPSALRGSATGVFLGVIGGDFERRQGVSDVLTAVGDARLAAAGRLSYLYGFEGPSLMVGADRASSLVAIHQACQSLRTGECGLAIAGGANVILSADHSRAFARAQLLAKDGRCKFGDADADGFVRSEGVGLVVLKSLARAEADGDRIYATIVGGAVQHGGQRAPDLMTPSVAAQSALLRAAYASAHIDPVSVGYIEAHGTGTPTGDTVELQAIGVALGPRRNGRRCLVGSAKTNFGHTEGAAGVVGFIKAALVAYHRRIPQSLHCRRPNPKVPLDDLGLAIAREPVDLAPGAHLGVSAFGLTGMGCHVVLGTPPEPPAPQRVAPAAQPLLLSAHSEAALLSYARRLRDHVAGDGANVHLAPIAAAFAGRTRFRERLAVSAEGTGELGALLDDWLEGKETAAVHRGRAKDRRAGIAFLCPGQGGQWAGMGKHLLATEPVFREAVERCAQAFEPLVQWSLLTELTQVERAPEQNEPRIAPTLFAMSVGLCALWRSWGLEPDAFIGTSVGEVAAAHLAGALTLEDAARIVCRRSERLQIVHGKGGMAFARISPKALEPELARQPDQLFLAGVNGPDSVLVSGDVPALSALIERLEARGIFARRIAAGFASHCPRVDPALPAFRDDIRGTKPGPAKVTLYSSVMAGLVSGEELGVDYWLKNLRQPVLFSPTVSAMLDAGFDVFLELSPHPVLVEPTAELIDGREKGGLALGCMRREEDPRSGLLAAASRLFVCGVELAWPAVIASSAADAGPPAYAFDPQLFPLGAAAASPSPPPATAEHAAEPTPRAPAGRVTFAERIASASPSERHKMIQATLRTELARVLRKKPWQVIDEQKPFRELGLTSIMSVELRNTLERLLKRKLPATLLFNHPTLEALASHLAGATPKNEAQLGSILVSGKLVTEAQLREALDEQRKGGQQDLLGNVLVRLGYISPEQLHLALVRQMAEPIAIIGVGCRLPGGVTDAEAYWRLLRSGADAVTEIARWPREQGARFGALIENVDRFDAEFFGVSPREAERMDPQQRILLEVVWEALENAGQAPDRLFGSQTGLYLGIMGTDYAHLKSDGPTPHDASGDALSIAAGRVAYTLGLRGPCMSIDTACSSSLVAVHVAVQALRARECTMALAGGVNLLLSPRSSLGYAKLGMMAKDGRCKTFDARADGYVRGEGCAVIALKRLSDALANRDRVLAVIRGSAINQDGRSSGLTAPSGPAQEAVIRSALASAQVSATDIAYVEAHGTGTALGDPIEVGALDSVLGEGRAGPLLVGSAKTNIGHLEAAAGVAGLVKAVLALVKQEIPPHRNLQRPNPHIAFDRLRVAVPVVPIPWPVGRKPRMAAVSSFGFSGTNAHVILAEAPETKDEAREERPLHVLALSAKTDDALLELVERYDCAVDALPQAPETLANLCYSAGSGRSHFSSRIAIVADSLGDLRRKLRAARSGTEPDVFRTRAESSEQPLVTFVFAGDLPPIGVGRELFATEPTFRAMLASCSEAMQRPAAELGETLFGEGRSRLSDRSYAAQASFAFGYAVEQLWRKWGVVPDLIVGHGLGEYLAACVAGVLSLQDGLKLAAAYGRLEERVANKAGVMSLRTTVARATSMLRLLEHDASIAAIDGPETLLVAGRIGALKVLSKRARTAGVFAGKIKEAPALNSPLVEPHLDELTAALGSVTMQPPNLHLISSVTGRSVQGDESTHVDYWLRQARDPIRFGEAVAWATVLGARHIVEIGGTDALARATEATLGGKGLTCMPSLVESERDWTTLARTLARLYVDRRRIDWAAFDRDYSRRRIALPTYPFERRRHWLRRPLSAEPLDIGTAWWPALADHVVRDQAIFPAAGYLALAAAALEGALEDVTFRRPLAIEERTAVSLQAGNGVDTIVIKDAGGSLLVEGRTAASEPCIGEIELDALKRRLPEVMTHEAVYRALAARGLSYRGRFAGITCAWRAEDEALVELHVDRRGGLPRELACDPATLDLGFQAALLLAREPGLLLPFYLGRFDHPARDDARYAWVRREGQGTLVQWLDSRGRTVARAADFRVRATEADAAPRRDLYDLQWTPAPLLEPSAAFAGAWCVVGDVARGGALGAALGERGCEVSFGSLEEARALAARKWRGMIVLVPEAPSELHGARQVIEPVLAVIQALLRDDDAAGRRLVIAAATPLHAPRASHPVRALLASAALERPELDAVFVDVEGGQPAAAALAAIALAAAPPPHLRLSLDGPALVPQLAAMPQSVLVPGRVAQSSPGAIDTISMEPLTLVAPQPGEVQIDVCAAGVNFRDAMLALDLIPPGLDAGRGFGLECAGRVRALGEGVGGFAIGDPVVAFAFDAFASVATTRSELVFPIPKGISFARAATLPITFTTAMLALDAGRLTRGQKVLIHSAAGGVGLAALQLALARGATVLATAGSEEKRARLEALGARAFTSRDTSFVAEVMRATDGAGVDVVLNSLIGDLRTASFGVLRSGGSFVEIGKRERLTPEEAAQARADVSYHALLVDRTIRDEPAVARAVFGRVLAELSSGRIAPLPLSSYPLRDAKAALRYIQRGKHVGKIVLTAAPAASIRPDRSYIITGGSGGIGLRAASWLAERGARYITLVFRRALDETAREAVAKLRLRGVDVREARADVSDVEALGGALATSRDGAPPVGGVIHAAGTTADGLIGTRSADDFAPLLATKLLGAQNLDLLTRDEPLDFFVCCSSIAAWFGSPGQACYATANAWLEQYAGDRRRAGAPWTTIAYGPWAEVGMAARVGRARAWTVAGMDWLSVEQGLGGLTASLVAGAEAFAVCHAQWSTLAEQRALRPLLSALSGVRDAAPVSSSVDVVSELRTLHGGARRQRITALVGASVRRVLGVTGIDAVTPDTSLAEAGIDSLMAVELRNQLSASFGGIRLPATLIYDYPSITKISSLLVELLDPDDEESARAPSAVPTAPPMPQPAVQGDEMQLSDDEAARLLAEELTAVSRWLSGEPPQEWRRRRTPS